MKSIFPVPAADNLSGTFVGCLGGGLTVYYVNVHVWDFFQPPSHTTDDILVLYIVKMPVIADIGRIAGIVF
jgi:hypothetical protein